MFGYLSQFKYLLLKALAAPATPAAGTGVLYINVAKQLCYKDDAGLEHLVGDIAQIQQDTLKSAVAGGSADALTATLDPSPALTDMMRVYVRAGAANATTTPTLDVNGNGAIPITKQGGAALAVGDIVGAGHELQLAYRASVPRWELLNPAMAAGGGGGGGGGSGAALQMVYTRDNTEVNNGGATIPLDSTTPQNTEGVEYTQIATSITPTDAASILEIEFFCSGYYMSANANALWAMFKDSDANAIAAVNKTPPNSGYQDQVRISLFVVAGSTAARTYKIRYGSNAGDTLYLNARNTLGAPALGVGLYSHLKITEWSP